MRRAALLGVAALLVVTAIALLRQIGDAPTVARSTDAPAAATPPATALPDAAPPDVDLAPAIERQVEPDAPAEPVGDVPAAPPVPSGAILVRLLDSEGRANPGGWHARARTVTEGGEPPGKTVVSEPSRGAAQVRFVVPVGTYRISVYVTGGDRVTGPTCRVAEGEVVSVELTHDGADPSRRIRLQMRVEPWVFLFPRLDSIRLSGEGRPARGPEPDVHATTQAVFDDVPPGLYTLMIDDPRFDPWREDGVTPGGAPIRATLHGSAALRLEVIDASSGAAVTDVRIALMPEGPMPIIGWIERKADDDPWPDGGLIDAVVPADYELRVEREGSARFTCDIDALRPGETREVRCLLRAGGTVAGRVVTPSGAPAPGVTVGISCGPSRLVQEAASDGSFRFEHVPTGVWSACALIGDGHERPVVEGPSIDGLFITSDEVIGDVVVTVPGLATLHGRLLGPAGADFAGLALVATVDGEERQFTPAEDGSYHFADLMPGAVRVVLRPFELVGGFEGDTFPPTEVELGVVTLAPGDDVRRDFDVGRFFPGTIEATVLLFGRPTADLTVHALPFDVERSRAAAARSGADGVVRLRVFPGRWTVTAASPKDLWFGEDAVTLLVPAGGTVRCTLRVDLIEGTLTFLDDATGEPLRNRQILVMHHLAMYGHGGGRKTDAAGRLVLWHPPGELDVVLMGRLEDGRIRGPTPSATVRWTRNGPDPAVVRFDLGEPAGADGE